MITCRQLVELLIDYVSGELQPDHRALVDKHLGKCPPCVAYVETYQMTIRITRHLPTAPLPPGLHDRLLASLKEILREQCRDSGDPAGKDET
jgi:anti-sigma factor RsiW